MGVNVFGVELESDKNGLDELHLTNDADAYSPYDDLSFIMYVDNDIADVMRQIEVKKQSAIIGNHIFYNLI